MTKQKRSLQQVIKQWCQYTDFTPGQFRYSDTVVACVCPSVRQPRACPRDNLHDVYEYNVLQAEWEFILIWPLH